MYTGRGFHSATIIICTISFLVLVLQCVGGEEYAARLQPEFDVIDVDTYLKNERLFNLQMQCLLFNGPCDIVGRWLKPRIASALLGNCLKCTPKQVENMNKILEHVQQQRPDLYRAAIAKYIENAGITVSPADQRNVDSVRDSLMTSMDNPGR